MVKDLNHGYIKLFDFEFTSNKPRIRHLFLIILFFSKLNESFSLNDRFSLEYLRISEKLFLVQ